MCADFTAISSNNGPLSSRGKEDPGVREVRELVDGVVLSIEQLLHAGGYRLEPLDLGIRSNQPNWILRCRLQVLDYVELVGLLKELLAIPMAIVLASGLPAAIVCPPALKILEGEKRFLFLFPGRWGRFIKNKVFRANDRQRLWWAAGVLALKKGLPDLRGALVEESLGNHKVALTTEDNTHPDLDFVSWCGDVAEALFPPGTCPTTWEDLVIGASATSVTPRSRGGARGELLTKGAALTSLDGEVASLVRGPLGGEVELVGDRRYRNPLRVPLVRRWLPKGEHISAGPASNLVRPVVVSDPLKARIVTLGHVDRGLLKPFQESLHRRLRSLPPFVLTGEWVGTDHLDSRLGSQVKEGVIYNSGDFSAATDNVKSVYTRTILGKIMAACYPRGPKDRAPFALYYQEGLNSLTENVIQYEDNHYRWQEKGQLMGSLLSFPVLCVFNFCVWSWAHYQTNYPINSASRKGFLKQLRSKQALGRLPVLINGDDILSRMNQREYEAWCRSVKMAGWTLSVGKSYLHPSVAVINSQVFHLTGGRWEQVLVSNPGLLAVKAQARSKAWLGEQTPVDSLGELATQYLRGSLDPYSAAATFVRAHKNTLLRTGRPLFLAKRLGGLGGRFPSLKDFERWEQPSWVSRYARTCRNENYVFSSSSCTVRDAERYTLSSVSNLLGTPLVKGKSPDPIVEKCIDEIRGTIGRTSLPRPSWRESTGDRKIVQRLRGVGVSRKTKPLPIRSIFCTRDRVLYTNRLHGGVKLAKTRHGITLLPLASQDARHRAGGLLGAQHIRFSDSGDALSISVKRFGIQADLEYPPAEQEGQILDLTPAMTTVSGRPAFSSGLVGKVRQIVSDHLGSLT